MPQLPSIYINLEDDVNRIVTRLKREKASQVVLVCPKKCLLFADSINLRLLKKQVDLLKKDVSILTMDEKGQLYAKEAGFGLKFLPKSHAPGALSDVKVAIRPPQFQTKPVEPVAKPAKHAAPIHKPAAKHAVLKKAPKVTDKTSLPAAVHMPVQEEEFIDWPQTDVPAHTAEHQEQKKEKPLKAKKHTMHKWLAALVACSLVVILAVVFVVLPHAQVIIHAKSEVVTRDWPEILVSTKVAEPENNDRMALPGTKLVETLEATQKFQSQGKKEVGNKAYGRVVIYNFTNAPLNLKSNTTQLIIGNKTYQLTEDAMGIKPTKYKNEAAKEIDPASLSPAVEIVASAGGESFNVPAGTRMEITNQVFGSKPQFLYAKTDSAITGGTSRYLSVVSEQDLQSAQNALAEKLLNDYREKVKAQDLVILDKAFILEPVSFTADKPVGSESPTFEAVLKTKITAIAFKNTDVKEIIKGRIMRTLASNKTLDFTDNNQLSVKLKSVDFVNEQAVITAHFEGKAIYNVEIDGLANDLKGKSKTEVNELLGSRPEIQSIDIVLVPTWQNNFPWFSQKIQISKEK